MGAFLKSGRPRGPGEAFKNVGGEAPTIFFTFIAQSLPPDPLRTQLLCNFNILKFWQCTSGWTTITHGGRGAKNELKTTLFATRPTAWQTLRGLKFIIYLPFVSRSVPKTQSPQQWDLELVSGADFWSNLLYFSSRIPSQGFRGPPSAKNPGPD